MEVLNWMAAHWVLTIVLALIASGAVQRIGAMIVVACSK
jgi:hypothetical protein